MITPRFARLGLVRHVHHWQSYWELCKPRVVALMLLTAIVGMQLAAPGFIPWRILVFGTVGIALVAASAAAINHLVDQHIDARMRRTRNRPLPTKRLTATQVIIFAFILAAIGMTTLILFVNKLTAFLTLLTLIGYAVIYTMYLKHATPQNIVIGGLAGAAPPLLGWSAMTGSVDPQALLLVLIIFLWTPPHFWSLAIHRFQDYADADVPMLPNTHGIAYTKLQIVLYSCLMFAGSLMPFAIGMSGLLYLIGTIILGAGFFYWVWQLCWLNKPQAALRTFQYSIFYLMCLFGLLLIDHYLQMVG